MSLLIYVLFIFIWERFVIFRVQVLASWFEFILNYFIILGVILNGLVFSVSFSDWPLLVCQHTTDFCMLIHPVALVH